MENSPNKEFEFKEPSHLEKLQQENDSLEAQLQEAAQARAVKLQILEKQRKLAEVNAALAETERELQQDPTNPFKQNVREYSLGEIVFETHGDLKQIIRKHALDQFAAQGREVTERMKAKTEDYVFHMADFIYNAKRDPKTIGKSAPWKNEETAAARCEIDLRIKPFTKVRLQ